MHRAQTESMKSLIQSESTGSHHGPLMAVDCEDGCTQLLAAASGEEHSSLHIVLYKLLCSVADLQNKQ